MKRLLSALAALAFLSVPFAAAADTLAACHKNYRGLTLTQVTSATETTNDFRLTFNGQTHDIPMDATESESSIRIAINGGRITLYADARGNLYGPFIDGSAGARNSDAEHEEHACLQLYQKTPTKKGGLF